MTRVRNKKEISCPGGSKTPILCLINLLVTSIARLFTVFTALEAKCSISQDLCRLSGLNT